MHDRGRRRGGRGVRARGRTVCRTTETRGFFFGKIGTDQGENEAHLSAQFEVLGSVLATFPEKVPAPGIFRRALLEFNEELMGQCCEGAVLVKCWL